MRRFINLLILFFSVFFCLSCNKKYKQDRTDVIMYGNNNKKTEHKAFSFSDSNKILMDNAFEHKYHWYQNVDGSEGGLLVIDKTADTEWLKRNLKGTFEYIQSVEIKNNDLSIIPVLNNCITAKVYNKTSDTQIDILTFPKTYKHLTFYDYNVINLSFLSEFRNLKILNLDCTMQDLRNSYSSSMFELIIRCKDTFDFSVLENFPNLRKLKIEKIEDVANIVALSDSKLEVLWIGNEEIYLKYKKDFEKIQTKNNNLKIWHGKE